MSKKIKLTQSPPVEHRHEMTEGNIYEVVERTTRGYWVISHSSLESVLVLFRECVVLKEENS
jgi:hypothetical protein